MRFGPSARVFAVLILGLVILAGILAAARREAEPKPGGPSTSGEKITAIGWEHKGFNLPTWSENGLYDSGPALEQLASIGANSVGFAPYWYQSTRDSNSVFRTDRTSSDSSLTWAIQKAHSLGLKVILHPLVDSNDGQWRAYIDPTDPDAWFRSYGEMIRHYADLAREYQIDVLVLGDELITVSTTPSYENRWRSLISEVRSRFPGKLTYAANWGGNDFEEEYAHVPFWDALDYLGMAAYFPVAESTSPTVEEMRFRWDYWQGTVIYPFQQRWGKPVLFVEVGFRSADGTARQPWNAWDLWPLDIQEQVDCWEAFFASWHDVPWFAGASGWAWSTNTQVSPTDIWYEVQNKPAFESVRAWFGGGRGPVPTRLPRPTAIQIRNPLSDQTYSGTTVVRAFATDASSVSYRIDEGTPSAMSHNTRSGLWEATLDTTALPDGTHNVTVIAHGAGGTSAEDRAWNIRLANGQMGQGSN